jgi:hypothetical protein
MPVHSVTHQLIKNHNSGQTMYKNGYCACWHVMRLSKAFTTTCGAICDNNRLQEQQVQAQQLLADGMGFLYTAVNK